MSKHAHIANSEKVIEALGYWPTFHDAEVISFLVERALPLRNGYSSARVAVHVRMYETVGEGTAQYAQVLSKSVLIRFAFSTVSELELSDFNHQNVINSITVERTGSKGLGGLQVTIESIWGFGGTLRCMSASVETVEVMSNADA